MNISKILLVSLILLFNKTVTDFWWEEYCFISH